MSGSAASPIAPGVYELSTAELQAALRIAGMPPQNTSPLAGLPPPPTVSPQIFETLRAKTVLNGDNGVNRLWRSGLSALTAPTHRASLFLGSADTSWSIECYGSGDGLVGYARVGSQHSVTNPYTLGRFVKTICDWLGCQGAPDREAFELALPAHELIALGAIVDAVREAQLRAFLDRKQANARSFSRDQIVYEIQAANSGDPRWFMGLLRRHAPQGYAQAAAQLNQGVQGLAGRGWVRFEGDRVALNEPMLNIATALSNLNPHARIALRGEDQKAVDLLAIACLGCYCTIEFTGDAAQPWAIFQFVGGRQMRAIVEAIASMLPESAPEDPPSWNAPVPVAAPPKPVERPPIPKPVVAEPPVQAAPPPTPVKPAPGTCIKCGKALVPGRKFCTGCGTPVS